MKGVIHRLDSYLRMRCTTVFLHIPECFLNDAKDGPFEQRRKAGELDWMNIQRSLNSAALAHAFEQPAQSREKTAFIQ